MFIPFNQMASSAKFRRCHVTCRFNTESDWINCINSTQFSKIRGGNHSISCMVSVYNAATKDSRVYMETDRIQEQPLQDFFKECGAGSFQYDSFGLDWESASATALSDVRMCARKEGYELMERGAPPAAASAQSNGRNDGAGDIVCYCFRLTAINCSIF